MRTTTASCSRIWLEQNSTVFVVFYSDEYPIGNQRRKKSAHLTYEELQHQDNYNCIGQYPKGILLKDVYEVWQHEFELLQNGFRMEIGTPSHPKQLFVCGGAGLGKFDMPEAQHVAGALGQRAHHPDRMSRIHTDDLSDVSKDIAVERKTQSQMRQVRASQLVNPDKAELQANGL